MTADATARTCLWEVGRERELAGVLARAAGVAQAAAPEWFHLRHEDLAPAPSALARASAPAYFRVEADAGEAAGLLAVVAYTSGGARVLAPDGGTRDLPAADVADLLRAAAEAPMAEGIDRVLGRASFPPARSAGRARVLAGAPRWTKKRRGRARVADPSGGGNLRHRPARGRRAARSAGRPRPRWLMPRSWLCSWRRGRSWARAPRLDTRGRAASRRG